MASEKFMNLRISPEAKAELDATLEQMGMKQIDGVSRLVKWFVSLDEATRFAILGPEATRPAIARMVLERMERDGSGTPPKTSGRRERARKGA